LLAADVVIAATSEKRMRLTGRPQMLPFFSVRASGVKRAKSPKLRKRAAKYVTQVAEIAAIAAREPGLTSRPVAFLARVARSAAGMSTERERVPAFTDSAMARISIISQTAGPAKSWKRRTVSMPLLMMRSWAAQTAR
jgi:hypothetical protein